jgi:hypothetical protein
MESIMKKHILFGLLSCAFIGLSPSLSFAEEYPTLSWDGLNTVFKGPLLKNGYSCWVPLIGPKKGAYPSAELSGVIKLIDRRYKLPPESLPQGDIVATNITAENKYNNYRVTGKLITSPIPITIYCSKK